MFGLFNHSCAVKAYKPVSAAIFPRAATPKVLDAAVITI